MRKRIRRFIRLAMIAIFFFFKILVRFFFKTAIFFFFKVRFFSRLELLLDGR